MTGRKWNQLLLRLSSADIWYTIQLLNESGVAVSGLTMIDPLTVQLWIPRKKQPEVKRILEKRGDRMKILRLPLLDAYVTAARRRVVILLVGLFLFFAQLILPTRVLLVEVEGCNTIPEKAVLEAVERAGVGFLASRKQLRSERVKNELISLLPSLQWAGVNTRGCKAVISVMEKTQSVNREPQEKSVSSIVSAVDAVIVSVQASRGKTNCAAGDVVVAGQQLISGYEDCGLTIRLTGAEGEVYGQTLHRLKCITPAVRQTKIAAGKEKRIYSLIVGKKRIKFLKDSGIWDGTCDRIRKEFFLTLPGGGKLPLSICCEILQPVCAEEMPQDAAAVEQELRAYSAEYLQSQMIAGKILDTNDQMEPIDGFLMLSGTFLCQEMIGRERFEMIGDHNGETS